MSCLPNCNKNSWTSPPYYTRPWFLRDYSVYEQFTYSAVPLYVHPRAHLSTPEIYSCVANPFVVAPLWSPLAFDYHQRENNYHRYTTAAALDAAAGTNGYRLGVLEKSDIIQSSSDTKAVFKSHQLSSSSSERTRMDKVMVNLIASGGHSDARILEQSGSGVEKSEDKSTAFLNAAHKPERSEKNEMNNISSEHQTRANCSISSQSCYLSTLELNLTKENLPNLSSSVNEELECKKQQKISIPPEEATEGDVNVHINKCFLQFTDNQNDYRCSDVDDDSQLDYHSAEEQDCICHSSPYSQKPETSETFHDEKLASEYRLTGAQPRFNELEDDSCNTSCSIVSNYCSFNERPEFFQMFQDGSCTSDHCLNSDGQGRDETVYSIEDSFSAKASQEKKNPKSFLMNKSGIDEKMKANSLTDTAQTYKMSTNKELFKKTDNSSTSVSQRTGNPPAVNQERTLVPATHTSRGDSDISDSYAHEQSVVLNTHEICTCKLHGRCKENFPNSELSNITYLNNIANENQSTVNQAVDAASDFRACFTTSRATNVKTSVVTRGQNTVISTMNRHRPNEWLTVFQRSVACNTDWSCMSENVETTDSQIAVTDMLQNSFVSDTAKHGWKQKTEDPLESKNRTSKDLNEIPDRLMHLSQEISDHLPNCCKEIWQRAIKAEMQLLKIRYQMYHQNCWQTYKPVMKEKEHINSSAHQTGKSVSQVSLPKNIEASSQSLAAQQMSEKPSNENAEERKNDLVENGPSYSQETTEDWFDATENPAVNDSSLSLTETQTIDNKRKVSNNFTYIHVGNLSPSVSEVDLCLNFQKYNVSEISICEYYDSYRYASLSFKSAYDASQAVKEMDGKPIKGKAVKVRLVKTVKEDGVPHYQSSVKKEYKNQKPNSSVEKNIEHGKNCNAILKMPLSALAAPRVVAGDPVSSLKRLDASNDSLKSSLPALSNTPAPISVFPKVPLCASALAPSKVCDPDFKHTESSSRSACFEIDQEDVAESQLGSVQCTQSPSSTVVPPNTFNLRSFRKVMKKLKELHPGVSRDNILDALGEVKENKGLLNGLPLNTIVQMTSFLLNKKFTTKSEENQDNNLKKK